MSSSVTLNEQSTVCRTCLKVLAETGFTYIDDESGYVNNVGNIREMLQFCVPELDLYVSAQPVICYQCLTVLVQIYNFKIKCLNGENTIKAYITRNNLQEYNHVNLNCVLMDDLKMKSQKIQIESRIKHMMLKELPDNSEPSSENQQTNEAFQIIKEVNELGSGEIENYSMILPNPVPEANIQDDQQEPAPTEMKIEIPEEDQIDFDDKNQNQDLEVYVPDQLDVGVNDNSESTEEDKDNDKQGNTVAVRKDLFENTNQVNEPKKEQPALILNNGMVSQNGRIVIKIKRKRLQTSSTALTEKECPPVEESTELTTSPPPVTAVQASTISVQSSNELSTPKIVTVETVCEATDQNPSYNCNKCGFTTSDVIKIYDHNRTYHSFDYTCQHCPFSTSKVELLGKHMSMVHPQNMLAKRNLNFKVTENYACSMCPFSVKNIDLLRSHHLSAHGTAKGEKGPIVLNTAFSDDLTRSEPRILKRLEYTCDVCPYTTKDKSNLRKHLFTHGTKPLKCDSCTYKCVSPYQLRRHQKQKHAKNLEPRPRNQPYQLPDFKKEKSEAMDNFKITLESIKRELEKEITT